MPRRLGLAACYQLFCSANQRGPVAALRTPRRLVMKRTRRLSEDEITGFVRELLEESPDRLWRSSALQHRSNGAAGHDASRLASSVNCGLSLATPIRIRPTLGRTACQADSN